MKKVSIFILLAVLTGCGADTNSENTTNNTDQLASSVTNDGTNTTSNDTSASEATNASNNSSSNTNANTGIASIEYDDDLLPYQTGTYTVGTDMPAGLYFIDDTEDNASASLSDSQGNIIVQTTVEDNYFVNLQEGQVLTLNNAGAIIDSELDQYYIDDLTIDEGKYDDGSYRVGIDIPAGTYTAGVELDESEVGIVQVWQDASYTTQPTTQTIQPGQTIEVPLTEGQIVIINEADLY